MSLDELKPLKMETVERSKLTTEDLLDSSDWFLQQKMDGTRAFIKIKYDDSQEDWDFTWLSSNGSPLKHAAAKLHFQNVQDALIENHHLHGELTGGIIPVRFTVLEAVLDAELIIESGLLFIFDIPWLKMDLDGEERQLVSPDTPAWRRTPLVKDYLHLNSDWGTVRVVHSFTGLSKTHALRRFAAKGVEGGVFKHFDGLYVAPPKKRVTDQLKLKFVKDADVVVLERNRGGTENAVLGVISAFPDSGPAVMQEIGSCSMIGKPDAQPGDVIEVQYLYWTGAAMIQPRMTRIRTDKTADECLVDQFPTYSREAVL